MDLTLTTTSYGVDNQGWVGSRHGINSARPVTINLASFTAGTHYPEGWLLSGIPLGIITASSQYGLFDGAAVDGRSVLRGFLLTSVKATGSPVGAMLSHGMVVLSKLPVTVAASALPASITAVL